MPEKPIRKIYLEETDSTNTYITRNANKLEFPVCVISSYQNAGKGQGENRWESKKDKNLLFSFAFHPRELETKKNFYLSRISSLAIAEYFEDLIDDVSIKWPNDILCGNRKIAGILIENTIQGDKTRRTIIGIGANINQFEFPVFSLGPAATSLFLETGREFEIKAALDDILDKLSCWIAILNSRDFKTISENYNRRLFRHGKKAFFTDSRGIFKAKIISISDDGHLILKTESGEIRDYAFQEISFKM